MDIITTSAHQHELTLSRAARVVFPIEAEGRVSSSKGCTLKMHNYVLKVHNEDIHKKLYESSSISKVFTLLEKIRHPMSRGILFNQFTVLATQCSIIFMKRLPTLLEVEDIFMDLIM